MRWKTRPPENLDKRERLRFAWWPLRGTDGYTYWLRDVREMHEFTCSWVGCGWDLLWRQGI